MAIWCHEVAVARILTYDCGWDDAALNYGMVLASTPLTAAAVALANRGAASKEEESQRRRRWRLWWATQAFLWCYQVGLCLLLDFADSSECVGISIVWSAHAGWLVMFPRFAQLPSDSESLGLQRCIAAYCYVACAAVWGYYAAVDPFITTLAHVLAVLMGAMLARGYVWLAPDLGRL